MKTLPTQSEGHLVVAAARVLRHLTGRPPTNDEIADHLGFPREEVAHWARGLERHGVLQRVESAFDLRYELADHTLLETLPGAPDAAAIKKELDAFEEAHRDRHKDLAELFGGAGEAARARTGRLSDELEKFKRSSKVRSPFARPSAEEDDENAD